MEEHDFRILIALTMFATFIVSTFWSHANSLYLALFGATGVFTIFIITLRVNKKESGKV